MNEKNIISIVNIGNNKKAATPLFLDSVSAGFPSPATDYLENKLDLNEYLVKHPAATFIVKASGPSMIEAGINNGDTVIVKKADTAENGKIVVALIDDHEAMLKRIRRKGKTIALESANRNYETKIFGPDRVKVQGVLVSLYRNF